MHHAPSRVALRVSPRLFGPLLQGTSARSYATHAGAAQSSQNSNKSVWLLSLAALGCGGWFWQQSRASSSRSLSYAYFTPLSISSVERISADTSILSLKLPHHLKPDPAAYPEPADSPLQAVYVRQPELQIQRAYTPLDVDCFSAANSEDANIRLLVKRYDDGEASSYIHRLKAGDELFVRGPVRTWTLSDCDRLIFIAGGTGVTPLAQMLSQRERLTKDVRLIYASSTAESSLLPNLGLKAEDLDIQHVAGRITERHLRQFVGLADASQRTRVIVCGPEGFIADIAGQRSQNAARDTVGGMLGRLGWTDEHVKKL